MPYEWSPDPGNDPGVPCEQLTLWPHRSLEPRGFVIFILITVGMISMPLFALIGTALLWVMLPFLAVAVGGIWFAIRKSNSDGQLCEHLTLCDTQLRLVRQNPKGDQQTWEANPYWVRLDLHDSQGPVKNYLTMKGAGRQVELGAFLSPEERLDLHADLTRRLGRVDCNRP